MPSSTVAALDGEPEGVALVLDRGDGAELLDDPGEHQGVLSEGHGEADVGVLAVVPLTAPARP